MDVLLSRHVTEGSIRRREERDGAQKGGPMMMMLMN